MKYTARSIRPTIRLFCCFLLLTVLLAGCKQDPYTKTALLPLTEETLSETSRSESEKEWELKKIYRYDYSAASMKNTSDSIFTSIGWSPDEEILYTVNGMSGEEVTVEKVDVRYGFHETCASLGVLPYRNLKLSPDGSCVVYTVPTDHNTLELCLFDLTDQQEVLIRELPDTFPFITLDFLFSGDGKRVFFWYTANADIPSDIYSLLYDNFSGLFPSADVQSESGDLLLSVMSYTIPEERFETYSPIADLFPLSEEPVDPVLLPTDIRTNDSGSFLLLTLPLDECILLSTGTGLSSFLPEMTGFDSQILPEPAISEDAGEKPFGNGESDDDSSYAISVEGTEYSGLSEHYLYGSADRLPSLLSFSFTSDLPRWHQYVPNSTKSFENTAADGNSFLYLLTADESHLLFLQTAKDGSCTLYLYPFSLDSSGNSIRLGIPELLYQSSDPITEVTCTPDNHHIILRSQDVHSTEVDSTQYQALVECFEAYGYDLEFLYKMYGYDFPSLLIPSRIRADYQVTILAF